MHSTSSRQMAVTIALISAFATILAFIVGERIHTTNIFITGIISFLSIFLIVYLFVFFSLNKFIFEKINPIYKTIHNVNIPDKELWQDLEDKDIIAEVKNEVLIWARNKTKEIAHLRQLEKYRKEFLGNVSHELKTPIFNIQGYLLTLLDGGLEDASINKHYLERAEKSINRLISVVNDLESISRLESGELKLNYSDFNIIKLFEESFEMHEMLAKESKIKLNFARTFDKPIRVRADRPRIMEAVDNLLVNSIKYGKSNGTALIDFMDMGDNILIEIADDGLGISEIDLPRIFERFYRTDKSRSREMGGTGLGLSIVKHIIDAHSQTINARSTLGVGSSFAFTLSKAE